MLRGLGSLKAGEKANYKSQLGRTRDLITSLVYSLT